MLTQDARGELAGSYLKAGITSATIAAPRHRAGLSGVWGQRDMFPRQPVAQNILIQILTGPIVPGAPDRDAAVREALVQGTGAIRANATCHRSRLMLDDAS